MSQPASDARFAARVRLFNHGNLFEAHDVWEQVWKNAEGE
jgi:predicted metal-dependent hydrolase